MNCFSCKKLLLPCTDCYASDCNDCLLRVGHFACPCGNYITCHESGVCKKCIKPYTWITDSIAIGDHTTPNSLFHTIVDLNYPFNQTEEGRIGVLGNVISVGLKDSTSSMYTFESLASRVLEILKETPHVRILFRCYAGVSRSPSMAALYLEHFHHTPRNQALQLIQKKRPQVRPNPGFRMILEKNEI